MLSCVVMCETELLHTITANIEQHFKNLEITLQTGAAQKYNVKQNSGTNASK